jgi:hypothetical protein
LGGTGGALWLPDYLLEEGCHSAGFIATIHLRHHLLLSIGWRFSLFAPEEYRKYGIIHFGCQWEKFNSYKTVIQPDRVPHILLYFKIGIPTLKSRRNVKQLMRFSRLCREKDQIWVSTTGIPGEPLMRQAVKPGICDTF